MTKHRTEDVIAVTGLLIIMLLIGFAYGVVVMGSSPEVAPSIIPYAPSTPGELHEETHLRFDSDGGLLHTERRLHQAGSSELRNSGTTYSQDAAVHSGV